MTDPAGSAATRCTGIVKTCTNAAPCEAQATTGVVSPITAACAPCHDSALAVDHMRASAGAFYEPRSTALTRGGEQCLLCHASGRIADIDWVHTHRFR